MLMSSYLLHGELQKVIIHVGTTNTMTYTPKEILKKKWRVLFVYRPPKNNNKALFFNEIFITLNQITNTKIL